MTKKRKRILWTIFSSVLILWLLFRPGGKFNRHIWMSERVTAETGIKYIPIELAYVAKDGRWHSVELDVCAKHGEWRILK